MLKTYEPTYKLKPIAVNIWIVDGDVIKMNFGPIKAPFTTRMTIVKLKSGKLWIHSPIDATPALFEDVDKLGQVEYLISPNKLHYAYIEKWQKQYPAALTFASPSVEKRAKKQGYSIKFHEDLQNSAPDDWANEIDQLIFVGSTVVQEVVFFHKASKTLILTDLIENFEPEKVDSGFWRFVMKCGCITAPNGSTPVDFRSTFTNRKVARKCLEKILAWEPEKIIIAHGKWFESDGVNELERAFKWLLK